jgi:hypothetical protein
MGQESRFQLSENFRNSLRILLLLLASFFAVHFSETSKGRSIHDKEDLSDLEELERRVGEKLLSLGIQPAYELKQIQLDTPLTLTGKGMKGRQKGSTVPDFHFKLNNVDCFIEVASNWVNWHKEGQRQVAQKAVEELGKEKLLYAQLYQKDVLHLEQKVQTQEELFSFLRGFQN